MWAVWLAAVPTLVSLLLLLAAAAVKHWPAKSEVWHMRCTGCEWSIDLQGPDGMVTGAARMIADSHMLRTGHQPVNVEEKRR